MVASTMTTIEASMEAVIEDMVTITEDTKEAMIVEEDIKEEMITEEDMVEMIEVTQVIVVIYLTEVAVYSVLLLL